MAKLKADIAAFDRMKAELEAKHLHAWVLFQDGKFVAAFPDFEAAATVAGGRSLWARLHVTTALQPAPDVILRSPQRGRLEGRRAYAAAGWSEAARARLPIATEAA